MYDEHRLFKNNGSQARTSAGVGRAGKEYERRNDTCEVYEALSRNSHVEENAAVDRG